MKSILVSVCWLIHAFVFAEEPKLEIAAYIEIAAYTDKDVYRKNEVVSLTVTIRNVSNDTVTIYNPDFWGVSKIEVYDSKGELIKPTLLKVNRMPDEDIWKLSPGQSKSHTYDNLTWYSCCFHNSYEEKRLPADEFLINLSITCPPERFAEFIPYENSWIGTLYANTVRITVLTSQ